MGRSPGKWIKTVLFGKKASRSKSSKGRDDLVPTGGLAVNPSLISQREPTPNRKSGENSELEHYGASNLPSEAVVLVPGDQGADKQGIATSNVSNGPDRIRQEQAATKAQAAFRGYLARRAFRALMGIIRLQALVRGHLVRRQAVATLHCVLGIVKFQALRRGKREDAKVSHQRTIHVEKLWINSFIRKLHVSSPNTNPLCLQYDLGEPNSAWCWLERWTIFRVWEPLPQPKKVTDSKSHIRPKRSARKQPAANIDNGSIRSTLPSEKPKRNIKKVSGHSVDMIQESSQNELEKVKRNLRKVSNSTNETNQNEVETEKPKRIPKRTPSSSAPDVSDRLIGEPAENEKLKHIPRAPGSKSECSGQADGESERLKCVPRKSYSQAPDVPDDGKVESAVKKRDSPEQSSEHPEESHTPKPSTENEIIDVLHDDHSSFDSSALDNHGKDENTHATNGKIISKEDQASNENQKSSRRRASLPTKQEHPEIGSQNSPKLPSYMAATESVKAKLRAQGSPRSAVTDVIDQNGVTRRHSLPSSTNGKMSSLSPRTQRPQANGKGVVKHERSILSSKDGNEKVAQEWKR